jgi:hypothetical protein
MLQYLGTEYCKSTVTVTVSVSVTVSVRCISVSLSVSLSQCQQPKKLTNNSRMQLSVASISAAQGVQPPMNIRVPGYRGTGTRGFAGTRNLFLLDTQVEGFSSLIGYIYANYGTGRENRKSISRCAYPGTSTTAIGLPQISW